MAFGTSLAPHLNVRGLWDAHGNDKRVIGDGPRGRDLVSDDKPTPSGLGGPERRPKYIVWHIALLPYLGA